MSRRAVVVPPPKNVTRIVSKSGAVYWYHQERRGKEDAGPRTRLPDYGTPDFWTAIAKLTGEAKPAGATIKSLIETYKTQPEWLKHRPNTLTTYGHALGHIEAAWGEQDPAALTVAHVMAMRATFADRPAMGNMVLVQIRQLMKLAVQLGMRRDNPSREVDGLEEDPDEAKPFSPEAWAAITSDAAPVALRRYAVLGRAIGQRVSDVIRIRPADRDQDGFAHTITKLGDKDHWSPLRPDEAAEIDGWKQFPNSPYVTDERGRRMTDKAVRKMWSEFAATEAGKALRGFTTHDLRATKVCDERIRGKNHQQIAAMVGMSIQMVMKYSRHIDQRLAARGTSAEQASVKNHNE